MIKVTINNVVFNVKIKISISNKCCIIELSGHHQRILKKNQQLPWTKIQLFSTLIIIRNVFWAANQHIRMISEGSCDTFHNITVFLNR